MSSFQHVNPVGASKEGGKEGFFEWIIAFEDVRHYFTSHYTGFPAVAGEENNRLLRALEIGCGTSALAVDLSQKLQFGQVVSIDNDEGCVEHMSRAHKDIADIQWIVFDVIEDVHTFTNTALDNDSYFDMVVDKGTLDAVLVEGTIAPMLEWVKRKLKVNGVYILFSIWSKALLEPLFSIEDLEYTVFIEEIAVSDEYKKGTVVICRKKSDDITINVLNLAEKERAVMDAHFKEEDPLLTPELEMRIREAFKNASTPATSSTGKEGVSMRIEDVFDVIFGVSDKESTLVGGGGGGGTLAALSGFTIDLFLEDLLHFPRTNENELTVEETIEFIRQMQ